MSWGLWGERYTASLCRALTRPSTFLVYVVMNSYSLTADPRAYGGHGESGVPVNLQTPREILEIVECDLLQMLNDLPTRPRQRSRSQLGSTGTLQHDLSDARS